jgi:hypothetical protein
MDKVEHKHSKVTTTTALDDHTDEIKTNSFYEQLAHSKTEIEKFKLCRKQDVLKELLDAVSHLNDGSSEVCITVRPTSKDNIVKVTKRWTTVTESFGRK